ncbi:hypothetical protein Ade02nite_95620 [Paractinoplanes deccanensis]|uniref:Uncharacterized protein n=1 Tax=Paractinoplanes deccanensis TaxID=113561 RepID=A0ABQ3YLQ1_9ACTN|nr:hypothetical protein [Actinoplanes deccanensis]GID80921.1 hypothetical protein Ade02nite_95620 [Actinoplanes deccanensis]
MPAQPSSGSPFTVHIDLDDLAERDLTAGLFGPSAGAAASRRDTAKGSEHHGARDSRQEARERSGRSRSGRAAGAGSGRSYAFRRS